MKSKLHQLEFYSGKLPVKFSLDRTFIIAEIGNNHQGSEELSRHLIKRAKEAGADAVKLQMRNVDQVFTKAMRDGPHAASEDFGPNYGTYRKKLELLFQEHARLKSYAETEIGIPYFVTPFDESSVGQCEALVTSFYKISSFDVTTTPLLVEIAKMGKPIIMSTGMCEAFELDLAVNTIRAHNSQLVLLHCVSEYPTMPEHANLRIISYLRKRYPGLIIGYSGHESGIDLSIAAITLGARVVERHFTCDKSFEGPDHSTVSIDFLELKALVEAARKIEIAMGDGIKKVESWEMRARNKHTKSLTSLVEISEGAVVAKEMLTYKSPGHGIKPYRLEEVIGRRAKRTIAPDTTITDDDILWE